MLLALIIMLSIWAISLLIGKYWLKNCGKLLASILALFIASAGAVIQVFIAATLNESAGIQVDPMSYINNAFLTLCISIYIVYTSLRKKYAGDEISNT